MNLDSVLCPGYKPVFFKYSGDYHEFAPCKGDSVVMLNAYTYKDDKLGVHTDVPRLHKAALINKTIVNPYQPSDFDVYPYNVTNGYIAVSESNSRVLYASSHTPDLELYDNDMNLLHNIRIPDNYEDKIQIIQKEATGLVFQSWLPTAGYTLSVVNDCFYLLYNGFCYEVGTFSIENNQDPKYFPLILKIGMDGRLQKVYHCDRYIFNMSIVENGKIAYLSGYDDEGNYALYKYVLEK